MTVYWDSLVENQDLGVQRDFVSVGSTFVRCNLGGIRGSADTGGGKNQTRYLECSFDGLVLDWRGVGVARFERCSFRGVRIKKLQAPAAEFVDCTFSGSLRSSVFSRTVDQVIYKELERKVNNFSGNDFTDCDFYDVEFRNGIDLTQQRLPVGRGYVLLPDSQSQLAQCRAALDVVFDEPERERARLLLEIWLDASPREPQMLVQPDTCRNPSVARKLAELAASFGNRAPGSASPTT